MRQLDETKEQLKHEPDGQRSTTDPDSRSMNSQAKGSGLVGYNVQAAVDAKHHLIVAHDVRARRKSAPRVFTHSLGPKQPPTDPNRLAETGRSASALSIGGYRCA